MKKILLFLTALFTTIGYSQTVIVNNITYNVTSTTNNTVEVIGYNINGGTNVIIPETITPNSSGKSSISNSSNNQMITYTVTNIANQAFMAKGIISVTIPDSVTNIGSQAFFSNSLNSITFGAGIQTIGFRAFGDNQLTSIDLPNSLISLGWRAFETNSIASVTIPSNVTDIGLAAFRYNPLTCITSEATTPPTITTEANTNDSFASNRSNIDLTIPTGTTAAYTTDNGALWTGFNSVTENSGNTFILDNITYVITSTTTVTATDYNTAGGTVVNIPATVSRACNTYSVTTIGNLAFASNNLTSVIIPNSVVTINYSAFSGNNLTSVIIPDSVEIIGQTAFHQNNNMNSLVLGNNVTSIGESAFAFCDLTSVIIPDSVITINEGAFVQNNNMQTCVLGSSVETIGEYSFRFNSIDNLIIPDSVISIGGYAFQDNQMTSLILGNNLETIGDQVFNGANNISNVIIPASVTTIGVNVFGSGLTDVTSLSTTPPTIITGGTDTFSGLRSTIHLHIPVGTLGAYVTNAGALWTGFNPVTEDALGTSNFDLENDIKVITTSNQLEISYSNNVSLEKYTIYSMTGAKVKEGTETTIAMEELSNGIYILKLDFDKGTVIRKVLIE